MGLMQGFFFELCNIFNSYAPDASAVVLFFNLFLMKA